MELLIFVFIFLLGTIIGSFLNVVIYRFNTGRRITKGRSMCMNCGHKLRWYELVPILSFLIQSGKCRRCKSKISVQYILVELITGIIFTLIALKFIPVFFFSVNLYLAYLIIFSFIFSILIVISVYDLKHKIIPDKLVLTFIISSLIAVYIDANIFKSVFTMPSFYILISGPLLALPFVLIWFFSKGRLMGLGDGKLILGMGWLLGISQGVFALILAFWIGALVSLPIMIISKKKMTIKTEIPFAPFLIFSTLVTFLFNFDLVTLIRMFSF